MKNSPTSKQQAKPIIVSHTPKKDKKQNKPCPKSNTRDKDLTSSTDCHNATKTTFFFHSRKGNNSNSHNYSETTINSQVLRDSGSKEREQKIHGVTPPKQIIKKVEKGPPGSPITMSHPTNKQKIKAIDWEKVINSKEKEIRNLEDVTLTMNKEIDKAIGFIEKNRVLPNVLSEKEKQVEALNHKLAHVMSEINEMRLYNKARSIPNIYESLKDHRRKDKFEEPATLGEKILMKNTGERVRSRENIWNSDTRGKFERGEKREGSGNRDKTKLKGSTGSTRSRDQNSNITGQNDVIVHVSTTENMESINRTIQVGDSGQKAHEGEDTINCKYREFKEAKEPPTKKGCKSYRDKTDQGLKKDALKNLLSKLKRSLSPDNHIYHGNKEKFKMYIEDPIKKMLPHYLKSKQLRTGNKELNIDNNKATGGKKIVKTTLHLDGLTENNIHVEEGKIKTIKKNNRKRETSSLSPKREILLTQKIRMLKEGLGVYDPKATSKVSTPKVSVKKHIEGSKSMRRDEKGSDIVQRIDGMLEEFCHIAEKYKKLSEVLQKKNQKLEKKVRDLSENKIKAL